MNTIDIVFGIANGLFLCASYPMMRAALKNRKSLSGFSFTGSLLTTFGMLMTIFGLIYIGTYTSAALAIPTALYWSVVTYYNWS